MKEIVGYSNKGRGIPSPHGADVIGSVIGDKLVSERRGKVAHIKELLTPSADRVEPRCPHVPLCGGCTLQQASYPSQLRWKQEKISSLFSAYCSAIKPIIGMEDPWRYRNKMEFSFSIDRHGKKYLGLIEGGTRGFVMNLSACHLTPVWFIEALEKTYGWWEKTSLSAFNMRNGEGTLRTLTLREGKRTGERMAILGLSGAPGTAPAPQLLEELGELLGPEISFFATIHQAIKGQPTQHYELHLKGPAMIYEEMEIRGKRYRFGVSPSSFFQPNTLQAEKLYQAALDFIEEEGVVYDLYCGTGTLGIIFASKAKQVYGIEINPYAVYDAEANIALNGVTNVAVMKGDVAETIESIGAKPDLVLLDPPRAGLSPKALSHLLTLAPKKILYISCNPLTQAENITSLCAGGYRLLAVQPVDQFPHTAHCENICYLAL